MKNKLKDLRKHQKESVGSPVSDMQKKISRKKDMNLFIFFHLQLHIIVRNDHFSDMNITCICLLFLDEKSTLKDD